ncbi:uncharacterized protein RAG0_12325 [Rhynchosporium agropyri]|uniref:Uncharacterized protein n=1 Tax=Rhynchosporium agropyri TaxID=914238 RepID=A0A1E1L7Y8_9HELO|nr:uncharacterized protein RAG0_12325 [Rhynchosporium agropyri]
MATGVASHSNGLGQPAMVDHGIPFVVRNHCYNVPDVWIRRLLFPIKGIHHLPTSLRGFMSRSSFAYTPDAYKSRKS